MRGSFAVVNEEWVALVDIEEGQALALLDLLEERFRDRAPLVVRLETPSSVHMFSNGHMPPLELVHAMSTGFTP